MTGPPGGRLTVLFAPDSFKGSLTSVDVATALRDGWRRARPDDAVLLAPLADGGEGTLVAIEAAGGWEWRTTRTTDPIGRPITARWLRSTDGTEAVVELAEASGLSRVPVSQRQPHMASTFGTGTVVRTAVEAGVDRVMLGIGGSATTDGGYGLIGGLGAEVRDWLRPVEELRPRYGRVDVIVACDVQNPLLGSDGAAAVYGPQKGASKKDVTKLERRLAEWAERLEAATGRRERDTPGAGAAGGVGFGLLAIRDVFRSFALRPGIDLVMEAAGFDDKLARADVVITGEGRIDAQTAFGKTALGVARRAHARGVPCIAVGGGVTPDGSAALDGLAVAVPVVEQAQTVEEAMAAGTAPLNRCGERLARLVSLTKSLD